MHDKSQVTVSIYNLHSMLDAPLSFITMSVQPNLQNWSQHLIATSHQITLIPNMPIFGFNLLMAQQAQQQAALTQQVQQHAATLTQQQDTLAQQAHHNQDIVQCLDALQAG